VTVSVVEIVDGTTGVLGTAPTVTIATTPVADDVIAVGVFVTIHSTTVTAVSGCGATWTQAISNTATSQPGYIEWVGTGATSAGTISVTLSTSRSGLVRARVVRGLSSGVVAFADAAYGTATTSTGPVTTSRAAGNGQIVLESASLSTGAITTFPASPTPSTDWATATGIGSSRGSTHRAPVSTNSHSVSVRLSASNLARLTQVVLGNTPSGTQLLCHATIVASRAAQRASRW
jgi:hypothetical protein